LRLAESGIPIGIEASAVTLAAIDKIDPSFIGKLAELWLGGKLEFIGSGLSQMIMPLVPSEVNEWNLKYGNIRYRELLGQTPTTALVNEQTFSKGLVDLYRKAGYETIIMDWDNCYQHNKYPKQYLYYPQKAIGHETDINIVWNHSIAFQKFQRYLHGELSEQAYFEFLSTHRGDKNAGAFLLYGNDSEVFDYRPGSGEMIVDGEFDKLEELMNTLSRDEDFEITTPRAVVKYFELSKSPHAFNPISLESSVSPIPCKKQSKYNSMRWAVTGRDSVHINTYCYKVLANIRLLEQRRAAPATALNAFKETLCRLWGSDYRTNTIDEKYLDFQNTMGWLKCETERLLNEASDGVGCIGPDCGDDCMCKAASLALGSVAGKGAEARVENTSDILRVDTGHVKIEFLKKKGFAISSLIFAQISDKSLLGTLEHGFYDDITHGADYFSGHLINVARDGTKITDLAFVEPVIEESVEEVLVTLNITLDIGILRKTYCISKKEAELSVDYRLKVQGLVASSLRLGIFTFNPDLFDKDSLYFESVNGGRSPDRFELKGTSLAQDASVSQRVSASGCLGATEGWVAVGDKDREVRITTDKSELYSVPLINYTEIGDKFFLRLYHSIGELDDTAWWVWRGYNSISFKITARRRGQ
jgi:hypothetical protein